MFTCPHCGKPARVRSRSESSHNSQESQPPDFVSFADAARRYANYYKNPFWSDPTDPEYDPNIYAVIRNIEEVDVENQRRRLAFVPRDFRKLDNGKFLAIAFALVLLIGALASFFGNFFGGPKDYTQFDLNWVWEIPVAIGVVLGYFAYVEREKRRDASRLVLLDYDSNLRGWVQGASYQRYEVWKGQLAQRDPQLYSQVVLWEQQQEVIKNQARIINQQEEILDNQAESIRVQREGVEEQRRTNATMEQMRRDAERRWQQFQYQKRSGWY